MKSIGKAKSLHMLEQMLLIRRFEEACIKAYQFRHITGFLHLYIGQEAVAVGCLNHLKPIDSVVTSYRCHAHGLALGMDPNAMMAELYGKITGSVRGKGGSMHFFSKEHNYLGGHGIVGGQFGIGCGAALASKYRKDGAVSLVFFGDGAMAQGTFHENLNLASIWNLPVIFICENNRYGMGTAAKRAIAIRDFTLQAQGYNVEGHLVNGLNLKDVYKQMGPIINKVRETSRPVLVEMKTYRFKGHSASDAGLYRPKTELHFFMKNDCIEKTKEALLKQQWFSEDELFEIDKKIKTQIKEAVDFAEKSPWPPLDELARHVYQ